jgi:hypothetical protein
VQEVWNILAVASANATAAPCWCRSQHRALD